MAGVYNKPMATGRHRNTGSWKVLEQGVQTSDTDHLIGQLMAVTTRLENQVDVNTVTIDEYAKVTRELSALKKAVVAVGAILLPAAITASVTLIKGAERLEQLEKQVHDYNSRSAQNQMDLETMRGDLRVLNTELKNARYSKRLSERTAEELDALRERLPRRWRGKR
jgi:hypothetical protein